MEFKLDRDLCFFDLEATGLNVVRDRIIQIAIIKYFAKGKEPEELSMLINPGYSNFFGGDDGPRDFS